MCVCVFRLTSCQAVVLVACTTLFRRKSETELTASVLQKRSKTHKALKERFSIRRNRTKRAHLSRQSSFSSYVQQYDRKQLNQLILCQFDAREAGGTRAPFLPVPKEPKYRRIIKLITSANCTIDNSNDNDNTVDDYFVVMIMVMINAYIMVTTMMMAMAVATTMAIIITTTINLLQDELLMRYVQ